MLIFRIIVLSYGKCGIQLSTLLISCLFSGVILELVVEITC